MAKTTALFFDVGGVILTNGWDRSNRRKAINKFELDWDEFEDRHELVVSDFETGRMGLRDYLERTVFYRKRPFGPDEFKTFLFDQSQPYPETLEFVGELARSNKCLMATLNNESFELNEHRIRKFNLRDYFSVFFASCYLGVRKPDPKFYRLAKEITQRETDECLFIDDRELNVESAERAGMRAIRYQNPTQLREELIHYGVL